LFEDLIVDLFVDEKICYDDIHIYISCL
jgi:hypothetical protein